MSALNILLVDDDQNLVTTLSHGLQKAMGHVISVAHCYSGSEALSMLGTQEFDVVISDFHMPGMSGLELLDRIRMDQRDIIPILITAHQTDALEEEVNRRGIGYIIKPFGVSDMVQIIHGLIREQEAGVLTQNTSRLTIPDPAGDPARAV